MDNTHQETALQKNPINYDVKTSVSIQYRNQPFLRGGNNLMTVNQAIELVKSSVLNQLNVPLEYKNVSFANFDAKGNKENFQIVKKVVEDEFLSPSGKSISMILWGTSYGVGKTHLLYACAKEYALADKYIEVINNSAMVFVVYKALPICVLTEYQLLNKVKETFKPNSDKSEGEVFAELSRYPFLCIDDVVKYTPTNLDFYQRVMFQLVDERYSKHQSLILTTNKPLAELAEYIGMATTDRLYDMTKNYQLEFKGESHRGR